MTDLLFSLAVGTLIRATALAAAVALILALFRMRSSSTRHAAWATVLVVMLLMPVLTRVVPAIRVSVPERALPLVHRPPAQQIDTPLPELPASMTSRQGGATAPVAAPVLDPGDVAPIPPATPIRWNVIVFAAYLTGLAFLLMRFVIGVGQLARIRRGSRTVPALQGDRVWESALVAAPVTIGLLTPRVILPVIWREWPPDMLNAVVAHEREHCARRDPLIAAVARLNAAIFWFHPLAWWLERTLATLAEHACDDAAVAQVERRRYAETLLDIAGTVRRHHGRLVWHGVGVDGDGRLGQRIDRVLSGTPRPQTSRARRAMFAASCALAIVVAVACQQAKVEPLREDPEVAAKFNDQMERLRKYSAARKVTPAEAAALEKTLEQNPEDVPTRRRLLIFYAWDGTNTQPWNDNVAARRRHALWLAEHHPDSDLVRSVRLYRSDDAAGYETIKKVWLAAAGARAHAKVVSNASWFIGLSERRVAEQILVRARTADPDGPNAQRWGRAIGDIYGSLILGGGVICVEGTCGGSRAANADTEDDAAWAREKLEGSNDPEILYTAGRAIGFGPGCERANCSGFGVRLLQRASQLQGPGAENARGHLRLLNNDIPQFAAFGTASSGSWPDILAKSTGIVRLRQLNTLAEHEFMGAENRDWIARQSAGGPHASKSPEEDKRAAAESFAKSKQHAREALELASSLKDAGAPGEAFRAHIMYGLAVFREGDRQEALRHLEAASKLPTPGGQPNGEWASGHESRLVFALLKHGERQTIIDYYERAGQGRDEARRKVMLAAAAAIRAGRMPEHYQYLRAHGHI